MIYIISTLTIIILLVVYSFSNRRRNIEELEFPEIFGHFPEELEFKKNIRPMSIWEYSMKTRGNKNV